MATAREIVDASVVHRTHSAVFAVGSFADRVNFLAQQRRALNLVWALNEKRLLRPKMRVAVVGAGLAGVTAAAALVAHDAVVTVFDGGRRPLHLQRETSHRRVHPSINAWPHAPISIGTELPFFDWPVGTCDEVAERIASEFEKLVEPGLPHRFFGACAITDVNPIGPNTVRVQGERPFEGSSVFEMVILAIGFGREATDPNFPSESYWRHDNLENDRDDRRHACFVVSGCGDGGLIDALRIVHLKFAKGSLAFWLAAELHGTPVAERIAKTELALAAGGGETEALLAYEEVVDEIQTADRYKIARDKLARSLRDANDMVHMVDHHATVPFSRKAAAIHKLMAVHAKKTEGLLTFDTGMVTRTAADVSIGPHTYPPVPTTRVIIRHGARPSYGRLIGEPQEDLEDRQRPQSDALAEVSWGDPYDYPVPAGFPTFGTPEFLLSRLPLVRQAFAEISDGPLVWPDNDGFRVDLTEPRPRAAPDTIFGLGVEYGPRSGTLLG